MKRNLGIDLLRSISILYIVGFWHLLDYTNAISNDNNVITYRITLIILATFVLISGYFLGSKYNNRYNLIAFYKKRFIRIYPPYFVAIIIFTILGLSDVTTSIKAILAVSMFIRPAPRTLWFITMLLFFYLISPLCISLSRQGLIKYLFFYTLLFFILLGYECASYLIFHYYYLDVRIATYLSPFMTGVFMANNKVITNKKYILFVTIIAFAVSCYFNYENKYLDLLCSIPVITAAPLLLFFLFSRLKIESFRAQKIIIFLSTASYFMYLFHRPFYIFFKKIYFPNTSLFQLLYLLIICLPVIILASFGLQKIYDNILKMLTL